MASTDMLLLLQMVLLLLVAVPTLAILSFPLHAALLFRRQAGGRATTPSDPREDQSTSVIIPVRGVDEDAGVNFVSLLGQRVPGALEFLFCVEDEADPVVPLVRRLVGGQPPGRARLLITGPAGPSLGKMHNLVSGVAAARGTRLVFIDSDVRLPDPNYIARFVGALRRPGVGLVSCYPANRGAHNLPAALTSLMINNDLLGYFSLVGLWRGRLELANGACLATSREVLLATGGADWLRRQLLMDTALARRVCEAGYAVFLHPDPAPVVQRHKTFRAWWQQVYRWQASMLRVLPGPVYGLFCWARSGLALALCLLLASGASPLSLLVTGAVIVARLLSAWILNRRHIRDPRWWRYVWLIPAVELVNLAACLYPLVCRTAMTWRGRRYRVGPGGEAVALDEVEGGIREP